MFRKSLERAEIRLAKKKTTIDHQPSSNLLGTSFFICVIYVPIQDKTATDLLLFARAGYFAYG